MAKKYFIYLLLFMSEKYKFMSVLYKDRQSKVFYNFDR
jgi:uncharacterized sporulation protein YeaH/YhbH (DUF444 family)